MAKKIIMLTGGGLSTTFIYNALKGDFDISAVVVEEGVSRKKFLQRRVKRLGLGEVIGQVLFQLSVPKLLQMTSQKRIEAIKSEYQLDDTPIPDSATVRVPSVNSKACIDFLEKEQPDLIIVNGTRIISKKVLASTGATFVNTHAGITPKYRGVHGGYWAVASDDLENCGVTVHLVDAGIDTGNVLRQDRIHPGPRDNYVTYPYLQTGVGIGLLRDVLAEFKEGTLQTQRPRVETSRLWYHPTLWYYLKERLLRKAK